jgi:glutamyl-tRNA synthetase
MSVQSQATITRFAPSPTGHLHVGGARTALFCWAFARRTGGKFLLRIEDTDAARSSDESARGIMEDLAWLGIAWDEGPELVAGSRVAGSPVARPSGASAVATGARTAAQTGTGGDACATSGSVGIGGDPRGVGPFFQARRLALYNQYIEQLVRAGRAYPAFETGEELEVKRKAAVAAKRTYRYERPSDVTPGAFPRERWERACAGEAHAIRFLAPGDGIIVHDEVLGDVRIAPGELDDFVIRKGDGLPTYHFAVVVDDEAMGVTHVLRAQEHLANTPRHVALQRALTREGAAFRTPVYAHVPLIFNMDGAKMSKRDKAKAARKALKDALAKPGAPTVDALAGVLGLAAGELASFLAAESDSLDVARRLASHFAIPLPEIEVADYRESGYVPEAIVNFLALLGWNPGMKLPDGKDLEKFDLAFLGQHFSLDRVLKTPAKFDRAKLLSFNADALGAMPDEEFARRWRAWLEDFDRAFLATLGARGIGGERFALLARAIKPRAKTFRDALRSCAFVVRADDERSFDGASVEKHLRGNGGQGLLLLREFRARLGALASWDEPALHGALDQFVRDKTLANPGPIAQALRVAVAGVGVTPGIGETLAVLGRASVLARIDGCLAMLSQG